MPGVTLMTNMLILIIRKVCFQWVWALFPMFLMLSTSAMADTHLSLLLTSNLQGKFSLDTKGQESNDPLLLLAQNIVSERKNGIDLYLDMGNAFYPGILSKYSSGSIMMDFLEFFSCAGVLVSSKDIQIGTKNLEFLQKSKAVRLLSSNIVQGEKSIFTPWFEVDKGGTRIAVIGISSKKVRFDIAEKDLYGYNLVEEEETLGPYLNEIRESGIEHTILLSGLRLKDTAAILARFPDIGMALCGGDYTGRFFGGKVSRVDLADGRSIVMMGDHVDYYRLELILDDGIKLQALSPKKADPIPNYDVFYHEFKNRLALWKEKFLEDEVQLFASLKAAETGVDDFRFTQLLRDRFDCELAVVEEGTIHPLSVNREIKRSDFLSMVNRDYHIFLFSLTGDELRKVQAEEEGLVITGLDTEKISIQGYPLVGLRPYRMAASQPAVQKISRLLRKKIAYTNTWVTVSDLLKDDLKNECVVLRKDYDYLDRRFRTTIDAYLSNFIDNSGVKRGDNIEIPPGQPNHSYNKWGLENEIDLTIYNKYHRFLFTPYMLYSRQNDDYLNNILRGTFLYDYNLNEAIRPYSKFRCDTVVEAVDGLRPVLLRETIGVSALYQYINGKLGFGFEKEVQDPTNAAIYGVELIVGAKVPFLSHFSYTFDLDAFTGIRNEESSHWQIRTEVNNTISAKINAHLSLSFRHKYFYVYEEVTGEYYQVSQFITSLDLNNDWKFW